MEYVFYVVLSFKKKNLSGLHNLPFQPIIVPHHLEAEEINQYHTCLNLRPIILFQSLTHTKYTILFQKLSHTDFTKSI